VSAVMPSYLWFGGRIRNAIRFGYCVLYIVVLPQIVQSLY
jgi:hypothetical protein